MSTIDFEFSQEQLKETANKILDIATKSGASAAQLEINESIATGVDVLNNEIENFETSYDRTLALTVYVGKKRGNIGITSILPNNIEQIINQAIDIAKYTQEDPANGIADKEFICKSINCDLELYHPIIISNQTLIDKAKNIEAIALQSDKRITSSDGSSISLVKHNFVIANTNDLNLGYKTTRYSNSISLIGGETNMQTDYWYSSSRDFNDMASDYDLAQRAVSRVIRRLNKKEIKTNTYPVIFESQIAKSIIGNFLGGIKGQNLFRKLSFLNDSLNTQIFPEWLNIIEDPFITRGLSSCYFDNEGVFVQRRNLVENGTIKGYLLSSYTARKLSMNPTGNAGGSHNIIVSNNITGDVNTLAKKMDKGLIIIETIGHGLNMVTGDYSVGASGLWVEDGQIQHFVDNITISGNMKDILKNIAYISDDYHSGSIMCGSMLVDGITVSN
ncbi:MAG: metallopeptidase TldD-related protein [Neisseriaceae bacterium]